METFTTSFHVDQNSNKVQALINQLTYKEDWEFEIIGYGGGGKVLRINLNTIDSTVPRGSGMTVRTLTGHTFPIPYIPMTVRDTELWILECILMVEQHEACEFFKINDVAIFFPEHGENANPYKIKRK